MWPFGQSIFKKTESSAERSERTFRACILELRKIDRALHRLEKRLPKHVHSETLNRFQTGMLIEERNAEQMLVRTRAMREHVERLERQLDEARRSNVAEMPHRNNVVEMPRRQEQRKAA
jgi:hypothetical protein